MKQLLIFDLDDTLIETHSVFLRITNEILARMEDEGIIDDNLYYTFDSKNHKFFRRLWQKAPA